MIRSGEGGVGSVAGVLALGMVVLLSACSSSASNVGSATHSGATTSHRPLPTNLALLPVCNDLRNLVSTLAGLASGRVSPDSAVQQTAGLVPRLQTDAQTLERQGLGNVAALFRDLSTAVSQVESALRSGGGAGEALALGATRINDDLGRIPSDLCGAPPSAIPT